MLQVRGLLFKRVLNSPKRRNANWVKLKNRAERFQRALIQALFLFTDVGNVCGNMSKSNVWLLYAILLAFTLFLTVHVFLIFENEIFNIGNEATKIKINKI